MQISEDHPLAPYTTFKIGGAARYFAQILTEADLLAAIEFARGRSLPIFVLGGGSNLVVPDAGYAGVVLHMVLGSGLANSAGQMQVDAGLGWDAFVLRVCEQGMSGVECLAGIPGLVGGSPIQNIGAYGQEVASTISSVRALDLQTLEFVEISHEACGFAYRTSIFNSTARDRYVVTRVDFRFDPAGRPNLAYADLAPLRGTDPSPLEVYHAVRAIRDRKAMVIHAGVDDPDTRSAGSFFKNPVVPATRLGRIAEALGIGAETVPNWPTPGEPTTKLPAAWLIERAGFPKGFPLGVDAPVGISTRHTLALVNRSGRATCADLFELRDTIIARIEGLFGITLEQEPVLLA